MPFTDKAAIGRIPGWHRRWYWRIRHRYGADWSATPTRVIRRELRRMSWRRAL